MSIKSLAEKYYDKMVEYRRHIHQNPEVALQEKETAAYVAKALREMGLEPIENVGGYGVTAVIQGKKGPGKCVGLRADMDALPIMEATGLPFASKNECVCHACGHDVHTATLLGIAHVLMDMRDEFKGCVKLVFQPAEEWVLEGGAPDMIRDGVMENPHIDAMFAQHVKPFLNSGMVSIKSGKKTSSTDRLFITVKGKSCHGAHPENGIDGVVVASNIITAIQTIVSRNAAATDNVVVTFGKIEGGERYDILAREVKLQGTYRTHSVEWRKRVPELVEQIVKGICAAYGADYEFSVGTGYPPLKNDPKLTAAALETAKRVFGEDRLELPEEPDMGGEDFAFFSQLVPSTYFDIGSTKKGDVCIPLHNNAFNPDEDCMKTGAELLVSCAVDYLNNN